MSRRILSNVFGALLFIATPISVFSASPETELKEKMMQAKSDTAAGAVAVTGVMQDCAAKIAAAPKNPLNRRPFELMLREAQDAAIKMVSPEAQKVFAAMLPRMQ